MTISRFGGALALPVLLGACPALAQTAPRSPAPLSPAPLSPAPLSSSAPLTDTIVVVGTAAPIASATQSADPVSGHATAPDAAALVARLPGAALVNNGAISGQVQFRGLFGERLAIRVGGQAFQTGGPNAMDPPLHYAPAILLDRISISRGAAPVREGPGMGAAVDARLKSVGFGTGSTLAPVASTATSFRTADNGIAVGGVAGLASDSVRINAIAAWEQGDDYRIPGGRAADTAYRRLTYGLSAGLRRGGNILSLDWRRQETGASGNPPFAMDIDFFHTDFLRAAFSGTIAGRPVELAIGHTRVDHGMDNFARRPPPATTAQYRYSAAQAETFTASARIGFGALTVGADAERIDRTVTITNPTAPAFFVASLDRVAQRRIGGFAELEARRGDWRADIGARIDAHAGRMADPRTGAGVPPMLAQLARTVALANAERSNTTWDAVLRLWRESGTARPRLVLSRKSRVPNAVERFGWLPTEASGGLADGNIHIGNQTLVPEVAWTAEGGIDIVAGPVTFRPSAYWRRIDNYIQGTPVPATMTAQLAIAAMNGDPTPLAFTNVDAEFHGFDADLEWRIAPPLRLNATASYVRGKRRDVADNLYRIAPLNGRASLTWEAPTWSITAEVAGAAAQRKVSLTNGEQPSAGWTVAHVWADVRLTKALRLSGGIENIGNRRYADHLAGINRVRGSDVPVGMRMPATGRSGFVRVDFAW